MKLSNVQQIATEDFAADDADLVSRLGGVLNYFMRQVVEMSDGNVDFDNLSFDIRTVEVIVDADGVPITRTQFAANVANPRGMQVISARNLAITNNYPNSQPFLSFTPTGNGLQTVNHVSGIQENQKYSLTVIIY